MKNGLEITELDDKLWYRDGILHREDGSALEGYAGYTSCWYHGRKINCSSQEEFERIIRLKVFW